MMSVGDFFYENLEPVWVISTAASPVKYQKQIVFDFQLVPSKDSSQRNPNNVQYGDNQQSNHAFVGQDSQNRGDHSSQDYHAQRQSQHPSSSNQRQSNSEENQKPRSLDIYNKENRKNGMTQTFNPSGNSPQRDGTNVGGLKHPNPNGGPQFQGPQNGPPPRGNQAGYGSNVDSHNSRQNNQTSFEQHQVSYEYDEYRSLQRSHDQNRQHLQGNSNHAGLDYQRDGDRSSQPGAYLETAQSNRSDGSLNPRQRNSQSYPQQDYSAQREGSGSQNAGSGNKQQGVYNPSVDGGDAYGYQQNRNDYNTKQKSNGESMNGPKESENAYHSQSSNFGPVQTQPDQRNNGSRRNSSASSQSYNSPQPQSHQFRRQENSNKLQYIRLWVDMCCEGCEEAVTGTLSNLMGIRSVECNYVEKKVVAYGTAAPADILKACKSLHKKSCLWVDEFHGGYSYGS